MLEQQNFDSVCMLGVGYEQQDYYAAWKVVINAMIYMDIPRLKCFTNRFVNI